MKKRNTITLLVLLVLALAGGFVTSATTGNLALTGTVAANTAITLSVNTYTLTLDNDTTVTDLQIATSTERSNNRIGYTVTISSSHGVNGSDSLYLAGDTVGNTDTIPYALKYNDVIADFTTGSVANTAKVTDANARTGGNLVKTIKVSYTIPDGLLNADTYSDTLTFTIAAK